MRNKTDIAPFLSPKHGFAVYGEIHRRDGSNTRAFGIFDSGFAHGRTGGVDYTAEKAVFLCATMEMKDVKEGDDFVLDGDTFHIDKILHDRMGASHLELTPYPKTKQKTLKRLEDF